MMIAALLALVPAVCLAYGPVGCTHWQNSGNNCHTEKWTGSGYQFGMYPGKGAAMGLPNGQFGIGKWPSGCGSRSTCSNPSFQYCQYAGTYSQSNCGQNWCVYRNLNGAQYKQTVVVTDVCPSNHPDRASDCCGYTPSIDHCNCVVGYNGQPGIDISYDAWKWLGGGSNFVAYYGQGGCPNAADMTKEHLVMMDELRNETTAHMRSLKLTAKDYWADTLPRVDFACEREHNGKPCCCTNDGAHPDCECAANSTVCPSEICSLLASDAELVAV